MFSSCPLCIVIHRTRTISLLVICVTWVVSLALMVPRGLLYATQPLHHDRYTQTTLCTRVARAYKLRLDTCLRLGLLYLLPLVVLIVCHLRIGYALWTRSVSRARAPRSVRRVAQRERRSCLEGGRRIEEVGQSAAREEEAKDSSSSSSSSNTCLKYPFFCGPRCANERLPENAEITPRARLGSQPTGQSSASTVTAIKIVFALTAVFAFGWLPLHLHYLATDFGLVDSVFLPQFLNGGTVALLFCFGANALNPILYCVFSSHFRRHFRKALDQCCCGFFKTTNSNSMGIDISTFRNTSLNGQTKKLRLPEACGRPLLLGRDRRCWTEDAGKGESTNEEEIIPRRLPVLQPRPASLLCEDIDPIETFHASLQPPRQHQFTLPGECVETSTFISKGCESFKHNRIIICDASIESAQNLQTETPLMSSTGQPSEASCSSLELQRCQDVSPLSVEKVIQIELKPGGGKPQWHQEDKVANPGMHSQTTPPVNGNNISQSFGRKFSPNTPASTLSHVWAWPSHGPDRHIEKKPSEPNSDSALVMRCPSPDASASELERLVLCERHSGSSERLDTTSSSSGFSTLHSDDSQARLDLPSVATCRASSSQAAAPRSRDDRTCGTGSSFHHLPKFIVHSIFSKTDQKTRNPNSKQHVYSKDSATSTTDLDSLVSKQHVADLNVVDSEERVTQDVNLGSAHDLELGASVPSRPLKCQRLPTLPRRSLTTFQYGVSPGPDSQKQKQQKQKDNPKRGFFALSGGTTDESPGVASSTSAKPQVEKTLKNKSYIDTHEQQAHNYLRSCIQLRRETNESGVPSVD